MKDQVNNEPVAWMLRKSDTGFVRSIYPAAPTDESRKIAEIDGDEYVPLYTHPSRGVVDELPELPEARLLTAIGRYAYTADQMRDYARAALQAAALPAESRGVVDEVAERRALNKALDALDALSERWASEIGLDAMCANLAKAEDVPAAIRAMAVQAWVEGAYAGRTSHQAAAPPADQHPDDAAVDRFAAAMKAKLAEARAKGRGGWHEPDLQQRLSDMLREHVDKGDPRDVANFACFLFNRGEAIAPAALPAVPEGYALVRRDSIERAAQMAEVFDDGSDGADAETAARVAHDLRALIAATPAHDQPEGSDNE